MKLRLDSFVLYEIFHKELFEPLLQNSIDHGGKEYLKIKVTTDFDQLNKSSRVIISDNGVGIEEDLLESNDKCIKKIFLENVTTKQTELQRGGYGCYIAYQIARRCGWKLDAEINTDGGSIFIIELGNNQSG